MGPSKRVSRPKRPRASATLAKFETTCPGCKADFDVAEDEPEATCPRCATRMRLADGTAPGSIPLVPKMPQAPPREGPPARPPRPRLTGRERLAVENALVAPALCALAVNLAAYALRAGGLDAAAMAGAVPFGIALASAIVAAATGLRGAGWIVPAGVLVAISLLWWQDGFAVLVAAVYLPAASLAGSGVLAIGFAVSAARGRLAQDRLVLQVAGLSLTLAIAVIAALALWFVGQLAGAFG